MSELVLTLIGGLVVALVGALAGAVLWEWLLRSRIEPYFANRPYRELLNFNRRKKVVFAFPLRDPNPAEPRLHPDVAWEDMRAINYVERLLSLIAWPPDQIGMRGLVPPGGTYADTHHFRRQDHGENVVLICSPKTNDVTRRALEHLREETGVDWDIRKSQVDPSLLEIKFGGVQYIQQTPRVLGHDQELKDFALLARFHINDWNPEAEVLLLAGIRAFGTWGAAKYLFTHAKELLSQTKGQDFGVVLEVPYKDWTIGHVQQVSPLKTLR